MCSEPGPLRSRNTGVLRAPGGKSRDSRLAIPRSSRQRSESDWSFDLRRNSLGPNPPRGDEGLSKAATVPQQTTEIQGLTFYALAQLKPNKLQVSSRKRGERRKALETRSTHS